MIENIVCAAIEYRGVIYQVPRPGRHHDVFLHIWESLGDKPGKERIIRGETQGFVTNKDRFVGRKEALQIAIKAKQTTGGKFNNVHLFSEDLW